MLLFMSKTEAQRIVRHLLDLSDIQENGQQP